jgi:OCT family organic cation transporter-like MFS transporter 4/5
MFVTIRFFVGICAISLFTTAYVLCVEMVSPKWRVHMGMFIQLFWVAGYMLVSLFAYLIREWRYLQVAFTVPCLYYLLYFCILDESPRWYNLKSRYDESEDIIRKMARINKATLPEKLDFTVTKTGRTYPWSICTSSRMRLRAVYIAFIWFVNSFVYYGLSLNSSDLVGSPFVNSFLTGIVEVPAYIILILTLDMTGRRWSLCLTMILAGAALLVTLAVPEHLEGNVSLTLLLIGKFFISISFAVAYLVTAEVFPTAVRNVAVSYGSFWARVGGIVAPFIGQLDDYKSYLPIVIFGAASIVAGLVCLLLPESTGMELPQTLEEGEDFGKENPNRSSENGVENKTFADQNDNDSKGVSIIGTNL